VEEYLGEEYLGSEYLEDEYLGRGRSQRAIYRWWPFIVKSLSGDS